MQHSHRQRLLALARLPALLLQTAASVVCTAIFCSILFIWRVSSELPLHPVNLLNHNDIHLILILLCGCMLFAFLPSLLSAILSSYLSHHLPRLIIIAVAAGTALFTALIQNWLFVWPLDWLPLLLNALAAGLSALCFANVKILAKKH